MLHRPSPDSAVPTGGGDRRITTLDGLRGLMTVMVIVSHYFGELEHGVRAVMVGWIAVNMFFVLSGFLIGRLILERRHHANFFAVFYVRRFCRIIPAYHHGPGARRAAASRRPAMARRRRPLSLVVWTDPQRLDGNGRRDWA